MNDKTFFPWNEGRPTKPEVDALLTRFPHDQMKPGWYASDAELRAIIGPASVVRFHTVCVAWIRRLERDHGVIVYRQRLSGYFVPPPEDVYAKTHPTLLHIGRTARKQKRHVATAAPTTDHEKLVQAHQGQLLNGIERATRKARQNVLPPAATPALPRAPAGQRS
jgi:hypothetical protein